MQLSSDPWTLPAALEAFAPISLPELETVALLERVDTKFALPETLLPGIVATLTNHYTVLEIEGRRQHEYETVYFDTDDFLFFRAHRSGRRIRHKVRSRRYTDSGICFLEVKSRAGEYRTQKTRLSTDSLLTSLVGESEDFVLERTGIGSGLLAPRLTNRFLRVTLAARDSVERVTIDTAISVSVGEKTVQFPGLAVAEVKRESHHAHSALASALRDNHVRPTSMSKYCIGLASLQDEPRHNAFKPTLRKLSAITEQLS